MSQIHVDPEEFADIVLNFLLEGLRNKGEFLEGNERWDEFMTYLDGHGGKPRLMLDFLHMDAETRVKYKRIQKVFTGGDSVRINIGQDTKLQESGEFDRELCKRIFRKVKEVRFKKSMPITEERLDKIIDYCINEQEERRNG